MKTPFIVLGLLAGLVSLQAEAAAGHFQFVSGEVKVTSAAGKDRLARKGDEISQGETITSSAGATAQVRMQDEGLIIIRPETKLRITTFQFNGKADGTETSLISLVKGGFRAITGMIGRVHKEKYKIETPTATIGIRGTDHEPMFIPNPVAGQRAIGEPGTYDKVNSGAAVLSTARGTVLINPNQAGFVANIANSVPKVLVTVPAFYQPPSKDEPQIVPSAAAPQTGTTAGASASPATTAATTSVLKPISSTLLAPISTATRIQTISTATIAPATVTSIKSTSLSTATLQPVSTTTIAPTTTAIQPISTSTISATTLQPISTTTIAPVSTTTIAPISTTTITPISTTTIAPISTTTIAPISTTTIAPISTTTIAPISTTTIAPISTTTIAPISTTTFSDRRLKRNIKRVGTHRLGIGIYEFDYVWGEHATGVMADEVKQVMPDAVIRDKSGYDMVDYSKLN